MFYYHFLLEEQRMALDLSSLEKAVNSFKKVIDKKYEVLQTEN